MAANNNGGERYERYNFTNLTEDDYIVSDILVNLEALINRTPNSETSSEPPTWTFDSEIKPFKSIEIIDTSVFKWPITRKRSVLTNPPPSPPPRVKQSPPCVREKNKEQNYSPVSPLGYEPNDEAYHQLKHKSKKRKISYWEQRVVLLEQTNRQLKLSVDTVDDYYQKLLELNVKLKAKRDEKIRELKKKNHPPLQMKRGLGFDLGLKTGQNEFPPIFDRQQQHQEYAFQQPGGITHQYYPVQYFQPNNDKLFQAAEQRHKGKIKIKAKKGMRKNSD